MALSRLYTRTAGSPALGSQEDAEFDQIYNNAGGSLSSPRTASQDMGGFDLSNVDEIEFDDASADPTAGTTPSVRNNGGTLKVRVQDSRTNTVKRPFGVVADTSGTAAASIGVGVLMQAESQDEAPSDFAAIDAIATDVTTASEDTDLVFSLRAGGAALAEKGRLNSVGAFIPGGDPSGTPAAHALYRTNVPKVWISAQANGTVNDSFNVSSITDTGTGIVTVTIDRDFTSAVEVVVATPLTDLFLTCRVDITGFSAGAFVVTSFTSSTGVAADPTAHSIVAFGDQT